MRQDHVPEHSAGRSDKPTQQRIHVERMLARAERRSRQAAKLVDKWKSRLVELDRSGVAAKQAKLWASNVGFAPACSFHISSSRCSQSRLKT
jgi:hypothetical protein